MKDFVFHRRNMNMQIAYEETIRKIDAKMEALLFDWWVNAGCFIYRVACIEDFNFWLRNRYGMQREVYLPPLESLSSMKSSFSQEEE